MGASVPIPSGTRAIEIDLSSATVLPGMIDTHVHVNAGSPPGANLSHRALRALANVQIDLDPEWRLYEAHVI